MEGKRPLPEGGFADMSPEERAELGRQGGIKSGEVRRAKKAMKESLALLLDMTVDSGGRCDIEGIDSFKGLKGKNITVEQALLVAQISKALKGDTTAFLAVRDTSGQAPNQKVDFTGALPVVISGDEQLED